MSVPDYALCAEDHRTLLVVVQEIGNQISQKTFNKIYNKICQIQYLKIEESGGVRCIWMRYKNRYPSQNNEWGDFQTYRKVLGLISIGKCDQSNVENLCKEHNALQEKYNNSVFDSRCLVFGTDSSSPSDASEPSQFSNEDKLLSPDSTRSPVLENAPSEVFKDNVEPVPKSHVINEDDGTNNFSSSENVIETNGSKDSVLNNCQDFNSLPNVNISESLTCSGDLNNESTKESSFNNVQNCSNFSVGSGGDANSPSSSKKFIIPSPVNSRSTHCIIYPGTDNCDQLEHDVKEFINSLFWILESKRLDRSFEKQDKIPLLTAPFEKKNFVGIDTDTRVYKRRCLGRMKKHIGDLALQAGLPLEALSLYANAVEHLKSGQDWLWLASAYEGQCAASVILMYPSKNRNSPLQRNSSVPLGYQPKIKNNSSNTSKSLPAGIDVNEYKHLGKNILSFEEIIEKFEDATVHYGKYQGAIVVELECSMKAARVLAMQEKYLEASECLKNVVFSALPQSDIEKMHRFNALAQVYTEIGFHRKASFFKRIAAMRCVAQTNPDPNWNKCYYLLLESLGGFKLPLDAKEFPKDITYGWPGIQIQMLHDLVGVAEQMNNQAISVRHMTFLLHTLLPHVSPADQQKICDQLEMLTGKCEGAPVPLALDNGLMIPPVNLLNLPRVNTYISCLQELLRNMASVKFCSLSPPFYNASCDAVSKGRLNLQNLAPHLRPVKMISNDLKTDQESIFIYSPIPRDRERASRENNKIDFKWVEGDVCEVALQVFNPLPFELKVTHMGLLADSIPFESFPACLSLPAESGPYPVNLLGTPLSSGELQILGYATHVLGVKSNCHLREVPAIKKPYFAVDVIPRLPQIQVSTSLPKASMFSSLGDTSYVVASATATMYAGESQECTITLTNIGKDVVERVDISLHSKLNKERESAFFTWSKENLDTQLPIAVGSSASFTLYINAIGDFVNPQKVKSDCSEILNSAGSKGSRSSSTSSFGGTPNRRKPQPICSPEPFPPKLIEAVLQIQYSGGPGMVGGYCRQCAVALTVEVLPSVVITKWDVLPSEIPTHCYLVLDILNSTTHEMEMQYASNKRILIEAHDICRIPVSVERCPLSGYDKYLDICGAQRKSNLLTACRDHLVNLVDLQWTLSSLEISGKASISDIVWTDNMLGFILMSPIQWDILLNGRLFKAEYEFSFVVGDLITITIKLHNVSDVVLHSLHLFVRGYQDHQNGHQSYRLETKRAVVGSEKVFIEEILPHEDYSHEFGFVFFHSGVYKLDILCSHKDQGLWPQSISDTDSTLSDRSNTPFPSSWTSDLCCQMQKCAPSIDITIVED